MGVSEANVTANKTLRSELNGCAQSWVAKIGKIVELR